MTYVDEFLQILVQVGQVLLAARVLSNQLLLPLEQLLATLLQTLAFGSFVLNACVHELILVVSCTIWVLRKEFFGRNQRQLLVLVAVFLVSYTTQAINHTTQSAWLDIYTYS